METISNMEPIHEGLLNQSLLILGEAGTGKTEYLKGIIKAYDTHNLKMLMRNEQPIAITGTQGSGITNSFLGLKEMLNTYGNDTQNKTYKTGLILHEDDYSVYESLEPSMNLSYYGVSATGDKESNLESFAQFIQELDIIFVDEGALTIGNGEDLHRFMDLCEDRVVIAAFQSLDHISTSQTYLESVLSRFETTVFFKTSYSFSSTFVLGKQVAEKVRELPLGSAILIENRVKKQHLDVKNIEEE